MSDLAPSFMDRAVAGEIDCGAVDDYVDAWHDGDSAATLHDFLGFTEDEYGRWLRNSGELDVIVAERRQRAALLHAAE